MKILIVNDIHLGEPAMQGASMRAASHRIHLPPILEKMIARHTPDLLVNVGDLIRAENYSLDKERYQRGVQHFKALGCPVVHLIGNHEIVFLSIQEIEEAWKEAGFEQKSYGMRTLRDTTIIWLGIEGERMAPKRVPMQQCMWLEDTLHQLAGTPVILFLHYAIDGQDLSGNVFYETRPDKNSRRIFLENALQIQQILSRNPGVHLVCQAHLHYFHAKQIRETTYVTLPALGDNFCGTPPGKEAHIPAVYTLLTREADRYTIKSYADGYCFAGIEVPCVR